MDSEGPRILHYQRARFVAQLPVGYLYTPSHFWVAVQPDKTLRVGLTKFGSRMLGEMVDYGFEVKAGAPVFSGQIIGWLEGFKALSDVRCVTDGQFAGANPELESNITLINQDPQGAGWVYAVAGQPDVTCVDVENYARILDRTIDELLGKRDA